MLAFYSIFEVKTNPACRTTSAKPLEHRYFNDPKSVFAVFDRSQFSWVVNWIAIIEGEVYRSVYYKITRIMSVIIIADCVIKKIAGLLDLTKLCKSDDGLDENKNKDSS